MRATRSRHLPCLRLRPASLGSGNSIRRWALTRRRVSGTRATIAWTAAVSLYWSAEIVDTTLIERLARLRGIGDAYHDYRGELRHFSLETKKRLLRAMQCKVDDPAALALELRELEVAHWRKLLPPLAAARRARIGIDVNCTSREFGSPLMWSVRLEDGSQHSGVKSTADCPEVWRGEFEGSWITRVRLGLPVDLSCG